MGRGMSTWHFVEHMLIYVSLLCIRLCHVHWRRLLQRVRVHRVARNRVPETYARRLSVSTVGPRHEPA